MIESALEIGVYLSWFRVSVLQTEGRWFESVNAYKKMKIERAATMVVLCDTVNVVPCGKHWGFDSLLSHYKKYN